MKIIQIGIMQFPQTHVKKSLGQRFGTRTHNEGALFQKSKIDLKGDYFLLIYLRLSIATATTMIKPLMIN